MIRVHDVSRAPRYNTYKDFEDLGKAFTHISDEFSSLMGGVRFEVEDLNEPGMTIFIDGINSFADSEAQ